jgi:chromosomal replication initiation ATPase DnaA
MVLQHMTVSQNEWRVWLEPTYLFHLNDTCAVVGTPNMFVRDEVANRYQNQLEAALSVVVGRALRIEVVTSSNAAMRA